MATRKIEAYTEVKNWKIYAIIFPENNRVYIGQTSQKELRSTYKNHYTMRFGLTKDYFEHAKSNDILPQMFLLEEYENKKVISFCRCVAWGKLFTDNGFDCINGDTFNEYMKDMVETTQTFYDEIKDVNILELISPDKSLISNYKPRRSKNKKNEDYTIHISVTPEENKIIEKKAAELRMSKTAYCKQIALNGYINNLDFHASDEYLKELREAILTVKQSIVTIYNLEQYFPYDLARIEELKDIIVRHYKDTVKESLKVHNAVSYRRRKNKDEI